MAASGPAHYKWKGGRQITDKGYVRLKRPGHPRATVDGYVAEHILIAEKALGKPLPPKAVIHHHNGVKGDNKNSNLVICEDEAYHKLLHMRLNAYKACGHADWRRCRYCKTWDDPINLSIQDATVYHKRCATEHFRQVKLAQAHR